MRIIHHSKPTIDKSDLNAVLNVLNSNHLEEGNQVRELENVFSEYLNRNYSVACTNGFAAVHLSLIALGIKEGDEVILPSYACPAILNPVKLLNAKPVIVDIEDNGFNIDPDVVKKRINKKTKAIIVCHIFGFPAQIDNIIEFGIPVIEDCAQNIGGSYNNQLIGSFGDISIFSFYSTKVITGGDGGLISTNNYRYYKKILDFIYYGHKKRMKTIAYNYHLTNLNSALIISQFKKINHLINKRKNIANIYNEKLKNIENICTDFKGKNESIFYRYPIMVSKRNKILSELKLKNILCGVGVLEGLHEIQNLPSKKFLNTETMLKKIISIPIYPSLTDNQVEYIADSFIQIMKTI